MRTSNDLNSIVSDEVQEFFDQITKKFELYVNLHKENLFQQKKRQFEKNSNREFVQRQLDLKIFVKDSSTDLILQYL